MHICDYTMHYSHWERMNSASFPSKVATSEQVAEPLDRVVEAVDYADTYTYADYADPYPGPGPNEASSPVEESVTT